MVQMKPNGRNSLTLAGGNLQNTLNRRLTTNTSFGGDSRSSSFVSANMKHVPSTTTGKAGVGFLMGTKLTGNAGFFTGLMIN
jgi:hypothetical protein